jgi:hypothetical protein
MSSSATIEAIYEPLDTRQAYEPTLGTFALLRLICDRLKAQEPAPLVELCESLRAGHYDQPQRVSDMQPTLGQYLMLAVVQAGQTILDDVDEQRLCGGMR